MKKAMAVINFLFLIALVLFLPGCGTDSVDTSSFSEGTAYSLPNGGILSYQTEETTVAAVQGQLLFVLSKAGLNI